MAIRLRKANGEWVALCAAETDPREGDVYLDDGMHYALTRKYMHDYPESFWNVDAAIELHPHALEKSDG